MKSLIDKALLATGRFGLHLEIPMPNFEGIKQIFKIHSKNQPIEESVPIPEIIKKMFTTQLPTTLAKAISPFPALTL